jgi:hypothetical protein
MNYSHLDLIAEFSFFLGWLSIKVNIIMKNEYYILFLIIAMIFILQIGVPLIVDYFMMENNDDDN